jgi:polyhydroxybutyrate depolymerase
MARSAERLPPGWAEASLEHDGLTRWYRIYLPDPLPEDPSLVLYLHGGTLSMRSLFSPLADSTATWFRIAEEEGLILVVPNGVNPETGDTYGNDQGWNDLRPDQAAGQTTVDDVGFLAALVDQTVLDYGVDQRRVFVTGASNGGMMTQRLLIEAPERFTAGASYIANLPQLEEPLPLPGKPTPLMITNGTEDNLVLWEGGVVGKDRGVVLSTADTVAWWVAANRADPNRAESEFLPDTDPDDGCRIKKIAYPPLEGGASVISYEVIGGGHTLPSLADPDWFARVVTRLLGPVCRDADGVELAWQFFQALEGTP